MGDVFFGYVYDFGSGEEWIARRGEGATLNGEPLGASSRRTRSRSSRSRRRSPRSIARDAPKVAELAYRLRIMGSLALSLCHLAAGRVDAVCSLKGGALRRHRRRAAARARGRARDRALRRPAAVRGGRARSRGPLAHRRGGNPEVCRQVAAALSRYDLRLVSMGRPTLAIAGTLATVPSVRSGWVRLATAVAASRCGRSATAAGWLPHAADATWTYQWSDSVYNTTPTKEKVTVKSQTGSSFVLAWTTDGAGQSARRAAEQPAPCRSRTRTSGLVNTDWSSTPPPAAFPMLCASLAQCGNSLASTYYNVIWGARAPVLAEPLLHGHELERDGRRAERRHEHERLRRHRVGHRARVPACRSWPRRSARRSRRPARSAIRTAAACARSGGCTASAR